MSSTTRIRLAWSLHWRPEDLSSKSQFQLIRPSSSPSPLWALGTALLTAPHFSSALWMFTLCLFDLVISNNGLRRSLCTFLQLFIWATSPSPVLCLKNSSRLIFSEWQPLSLQFRNSYARLELPSLQKAPPDRKPGWR